MFCVWGFLCFRDLFFSRSSLVGMRRFFFWEGFSDAMMGASVLGHKILFVIPLNLQLSLSRFEYEEYRSRFMIWQLVREFYLNYSLKGRKARRIYFLQLVIDKLWLNCSLYFR